jgi:hypothetical protein
MKKTPMLLAALTWAICLPLLAQEIPILDYSLDANGQVRLSVASTQDHYYVLHVRHSPTAPFEQATSLAIGKNGTTVLTEALAAYPLTHYKVTEHLLNAPVDTDGDGIDDLSEWADPATRSPLNAAAPIDIQNGAVCIPDRSTFKKMSFGGHDWAKPRIRGIGSG